MSDEDGWTYYQRRPQDKQFENRKRYFEHRECREEGREPPRRPHWRERERYDRGDDWYDDRQWGRGPPRDYYYDRSRGSSRERGDSRDRIEPKRRKNDHGGTPDVEGSSQVLNGLKKDFHCAVCELYFSSVSQQEQHLGGKRHEAALNNSKRARTRAEIAPLDAATQHAEQMERKRLKRQRKKERDRAKKEELRKSMTSQEREVYERDTTRHTRRALTKAERDKEEATEAKLIQEKFRVLHPEIEHEAVLAERLRLKEMVTNRRRADAITAAKVPSASRTRLTGDEPVEAMLKKAGLLKPEMTWRHAGFLSRANGLMRLAQISLTGEHSFEEVLQVQIDLPPRQWINGVFQGDTSDWDPARTRTGRKARGDAPAAAAAVVGGAGDASAGSEATASGGDGGEGGEGAADGDDGGDDGAGDGDGDGAGDGEGDSGDSAQLNNVET